MRNPGRLVVVANRLPVHRVGTRRAQRWEISPGGLVSAMSPVLAARPSTWVGWTGQAGGASRTFEREGVRLRSVAMHDREIRDYYHGICNRTFWPLYHDAIRTPEFRQEWWPLYGEMNRRFSEAAVRRSRQRDVFWVHDYHLQLAPGMIRALRPRSRIGFFLHIPFPPEELFAWLPWRRQLLQGLLGADVVGFQTHRDAANFSRVARRFTSATGTDTRLEFRGRSVRVGDFPISIDFDSFDRLGEYPAIIAEAEEIRRRVGERRKIILSVDRLDYTKGIEERLLAYERMLEQGRVKADDAVFMQVAVPSRENVQEYADMRERIERVVGRINGGFSKPGMVAVHYFRRSLGREELAAYYRAADVMLVSPLRDGMNLVCKEFVATRSDLGGVLVLSEFAGAAIQLRRALLVNPRDIDGMAATLREALKLPRDEARMRMAILRTMVRRHDVHEWSERFLEELGA